MQTRWVRYCAWVFLVICASGSLLVAQQQAPPDTILYNGKIVTMNDHGVNENVGTIAQALAIRGSTIVAVGTTAQVRAMAGPNTKSVDLKGRTVTPGYGGTHDHPMDWDTINPYIVQKVITDDKHIERFFNDRAEVVIRDFPRVLTEAVQKAKPGQWIRISTLFGKGYRYGSEIMNLFDRQINKRMLDAAAPNNPVQVRGGFTGQVLNQKAIDAVKNHYGAEWNKFVWNPFEGTETTGIGGTNYRWLEQDVLFQPADLEEIYRLGLSWMGGYGVTTNGSGLYTPGALRAYNAIDRKGQMPIRVPWSYQWRPRPDFWTDPYLPVFAASMVDKGSDYFWMTGIWPSDNGANCFTLPRLTPASTGGGGGEGGGGGGCHFAMDWRGGENAIALCNMAKAGGRLAGIHTGGDKDIDFVLDVIERCSKEAGMTLDQIRAVRHVYDHMGGSPRPDQVARLKNLGMMAGGYNMQLWEGGAESLFRQYGEKAVEWMQPRKSLYDGGVHNSVEIDRPIGYTDLGYFHVLWIGITRKDLNGKVWAPNQAVSRGAMLKSATYASAYYAKRENVLGSLEPGRWADLVVLDKDYMTIPVDDIPSIRAMMVMVGGKVIHLVPSLSREIGMQPTGAQVELGGPAAQW